MTSAWNRRLPIGRALLAALIGATLLALPASGTPGPRSALGERALRHFSQSVALRYWLEHPNQAPAQLRERFRQVGSAVAQARQSAVSAASVESAFNADGFGLPQNEESIAACRSDTDIVLGGTNDYRGLIDPEFNFTGWHFSNDGGASLTNEGLLPPVTLPGAGTSVPSGGDPVDVADADCNLFAASLAYDPFDPFNQANGIAVYRSDPSTLASCPGGSAPSCWPVRRAVAESAPSHFLDKEWIDVGVSGAAGEVVWAVYADFVIDPESPLGFSGASVKAVRCSADLSSCTQPILISGRDPDVQFADVTVGPDGRVYVTWSEIQGELEQTAQTFVHKLRIAPAGSTSFGPTRVIARERLAIPFGGFLHANDFRIATYPKNDVVMVGGKPRIFVVWDACSARPLDFVCEEPVIKLAHSDTDGASWKTSIVSAGGDNYFPTISDDASSRLAVAWFTNRFDTGFHNQQDVELVTVNAASLATTNRQRIEPVSNETEADPLLGGFFIGDYIEVFAHAGNAWVHYNANYRQTPLLGLGFPVNQQDNFLARRGL